MSHRPDSYERFSTGPDDVGRRFDRVARKLLAGQPLGTILGAIRRGEIRIGGRKRRGDYRIAAGDSLEILRSLAPSPTRADAAPTRLPGWFRRAIVLENDGLLALAKPVGVLTHGPDSLDRFVRAYLGARSTSLSFTPGPLHRLDRNTSGLVLFGKSREAAERFTSLLSAHAVEKRYLALLAGRLAAGEIWVDRLAREEQSLTTRESKEGREVRCVVEPLFTGRDATLVSVRMRSGFTHQIRAQAAAHSLPLLGDVKYGGPRWGEGLMLHATEVRLASFDDLLGFHVLRCPLPPPARRRLEALFGASLTGALPPER